MSFKCLKADGRRKALVQDWEAWLRSTDKLYTRFLDRVGDSPFDYHEVASVGFLASASAIAGFLPMNEYDVVKKGRADKRKAVRGRADLWFDAGLSCYSFEVKRTRRPVTVGYLEERLGYAIDDVKCVPDDEYHYAAACLLTVARDKKRDKACNDFVSNEQVNFAYAIGPKSDRAYLFFSLKD